MSMQRLRTDFQFAVVSLFAAVAMLGIAPFAVYRLLRHELAAAVLDSVLVLAIGASAVHVWRGGDVRTTALLLIVLLSVGAIVATHVVGVPALLWMYPLLAGNFLMVERSKALLVMVLVVGYLAVASPVFTAEVQAIEFVMTCSVTCLFAYIFAQRAEQQRLRLEELADHDALTGAFNRRAMSRELQAAIEDASRSGEPAGLALMDLDHFKRVNDAHGHEEGDRVLLRFADEVRACVRGSDRFFRTGGEEFLLLARRTPPGELQAIAERLRARTADAIGTAETRVTVSIGLATLRPGETAAQWLARADAAMYEAKRRGRDRIEVAAA